MILERLEEKIEEYRLLLVNIFSEFGPRYYPETSITRKSTKKSLNLMDDFLINYNVEAFGFYEKMIFLSQKERPNINGHIVFAENQGSNLCYVYNQKEEGRVYCVNLDDGTYLWEVAKDYESFFILLIEFLNMEIERIQRPEAELSEKEYKSYYNKCMTIVKGDDNLKPFIKFMCCIIE